MLEQRMGVMEQQLKLNISRQQEFESQSVAQHSSAMDALATLLQRSTVA